MTADPTPTPSDPEKKPSSKPNVAKKAEKKPASKKVRKKAVSQDLNKSEEIRKVAARMKAAGQKVRPSVIVQDLARRGIKVAQAQVSMVLKRMGFKPLRKRKKKVVGESKAKVPAKASTSAIGIEDLVAAKTAVEALGGSDRAIEAIQALKRLEG